jgi:hypothetical protein
MEVVYSLDQIKLNPGDKLFFQSQAGIDKVNISAPFIGLLRDQYVLSEIPISQNGPVFQSSETQCTVRFLSGGSVYGFSSRIVQITHNPVPIMFIAYPKSIEKMNLRKEERYGVLIPVSLDVESTEDSQELKGTITDLSSSGCRLISPIFCDSGDEIKIKFSLDSGGEPIPVKGIVRNFRSGDFEGYELGVQFQDANQDINSFLEKIKRYMRVDG